MLQNTYLKDAFLENVILLLLVTPDHDMFTFLNIVLFIRFITVLFWYQWGTILVFINI